MIWKNLSRRKGRTLLTILGISIGVAAIIGLGALAEGLGAGYNSMLTGSKADLVLSQPNSLDVAFSTVEETFGEQLAAMPETAAVSPMLQSFTQSEDEPYFFIFGYPEDSFVLDRFQIVEGDRLDSREARTTRGKPILLGSAAAEAMSKTPGDTLRLAGSVFRIIGTYQTGDAFEDAGAVLRLEDAQDLLGRQRQVSLFYIQLKDPGMKDRFITRVERQMPDLSISGSQEFADKQSMADMIAATVWVIGGLAIIIGGVGMMNAQLMSVFERTREIGVLRAVGWGRMRVLWMILAESLAVGLAGGVLGVGLGFLMLRGLSDVSVLFGSGGTNVTPELLAQAFIVVLTLGLVGGLYPAWRAAQLTPVEALRYEGGSGSGKVRRLPIGGMAIQSLWQRSTRTLLTLIAIGITVGAIMALEGIMRGATGELTQMALGSDAQIVVRQAEIADTSLSAVDERFGAKIAAMPEVAGVDGMAFTAVMLPEANSFFILLGYPPRSFSIQRFQIVAGEPLQTNRQMIIGSSMASALDKEPGDTIELGGTRFRIKGIYESNIGWEEMGGVITLRDAQTFQGRPRKVTMYAVRLHDPAQAEALVEKINRQIPEVHAALSGEFVDQLPDMQASNGMMDGISLLAIVVGGVGVLNTMLMAVFERTREIGVLRALGWRRRAILGMILREAGLLGLLGGLVGIGVAMALGYGMANAPGISGLVIPAWSWDVFARAIGVALALGILGGLYPAYRATRLQPVEALRYE